MKCNIVKKILFIFICIFLIVPLGQALSWEGANDNQFLLAKGGKHKHKHKHKIKKKHKHKTRVQTHTETQTHIKTQTQTQTKTIIRNYYYYPGTQVYFNPGQKMYFYREGNNWKKSANLPQGIIINPEDQVNIKLDSDKPFIKFEEHKVKFPKKVSRFHYYPGSQVYFNPGQKMYFYREGNNWKKTVKLPKGVTINPDELVKLKLNTNKPFLKFKEHKVKYPAKKFTQFQYFPGTQVYFNPGQKIYFYREGNSWKKTVKLPQGMTINPEELVDLKLDTDKPFLKFEEHKIKFPIKKLSEFKFFPGTQVYFNPGQKIYYYQEGTSWKKSVKLPENISIIETEAVTIQTDTDEPYKHYEIHKTKYKHKKKHKHKH